MSGLLRSYHARPHTKFPTGPGHWEGDLPICKRTRPVLVLEERKTRFVLAARLAGESAAETVAVLMAGVRRLHPRPRAPVTLHKDTPVPPPRPPARPPPPAAPLCG